MTRATMDTEEQSGDTERLGRRQGEEGARETTSDGVSVTGAESGMSRGENGSEKRKTETQTVTEGLEQVNQWYHGAIEPRFRPCRV
jgi:hypothetical protein